MAEINTDIDDEIEFHIQSRIEDLRAEGMTHQQAETAARAAFGSQASIRKQCQTINYGTRIWLNRLTRIGLAICLIATVVLGSQLINQRNQNQLLLLELEKANSEFGDVTGSVLDLAGKPIPGADVYVTVKTWPNNRFFQEQLVVQTDSDGCFKLPKSLPLKKSFEFNASVLKDGFAFVSQYVQKPSEIPKPAEPLTFEMPRADSARIAFRFANGEPAADLPIIIGARFDGQNEHLIYNFGECPTELTTDIAGMVEIPFACDGDELEIIFLSPIEGDYRIETVRLDGNQNTIVIEEISLQNSY